MKKDDEPGQSREDVREAVERFRMGFKDIPSEEIEQVIVESRRAVRKNTDGTVGVVVGPSNWDLDG